MGQEDELIEQYKQEAERFELRPRADLWDNIDREINPRRRRRPLFLLIFLLGCFAAFGFLRVASRGTWAPMTGEPAGESQGKEVRTVAPMAAPAAINNNATTTNELHKTTGRSQNNSTQQAPAIVMKSRAVNPISLAHDPVQPMGNQVQMGRIALVPLRALPASPNRLPRPRAVVLPVIPPADNATAAMPQPIYTQVETRRVEAVTTTARPIQLRYVPGALPMKQSAANARIIEVSERPVPGAKRMQAMQRKPVVDYAAAAQQVRPQAEPVAQPVSKATQVTQSPVAGSTTTALSEHAPQAAEKTVSAQPAATVPVAARQRTKISPVLTTGYAAPPVAAQKPQVPAATTPLQWRNPVGIADVKLLPLRNQAVAPAVASAPAQAAPIAYSARAGIAPVALLPVPMLPVPEMAMPQGPAATTPIAWHAPMVLPYLALAAAVKQPVGMLVATGPQRVDIAAWYAAAAVQQAFEPAGEMTPRTAGRLWAQRIVPGAEGQEEELPYAAHRELMPCSPLSAAGLLLLHAAASPATVLPRHVQPQAADHEPQAAEEKAHVKDRRLGIELMAGMANNRAVVTELGGYQFIKQYRDSSDRRINTMQYAVAVKYALTDKVRLHLGLGLNRTGENITSRQAVYSTDSVVNVGVSVWTLGSPTGKVMVTRKNYDINNDSTGRLRNTLTYLAVNAGVSCNVANVQKFSIDVQPMLSIGMLLHTDAYSYDASQLAYVRAQRTAMSPMMAALGMGVSGSYRISHDVSLGVTPQYTGFLSSAYRSDARVATHYRQWSANVSVTWWVR